MYISFAHPERLRAGGYWLPEACQGDRRGDRFRSAGRREWDSAPRQVIEYFEALDRRVKEPNFPVVLVLLDGQPAPGLPFLRQLPLDHQPTTRPPREHRHS